jgi:hypothetical protein
MGEKGEGGFAGRGSLKAGLDLRVVWFVWIVRVGYVIYVSGAIVGHVRGRTRTSGLASENRLRDRLEGLPRAWLHSGE